MTIAINKLTMPQLEYYRTFCNFVGDEKIFFELRSQGHTLDECCDLMFRELPSIKKLSKKVKDKMNYVSSMIEMEEWISNHF